MFFKKHGEMNDVDGWAVVLLRREVLWELDCKFIPINAASSSVRMFADARWSSIDAFDDMFGQTERRHDIPEHFTTDPQAEVMVHNAIPRQYISLVAVKDRNTAERLVGLQDIQCEVNPHLFSWRQDYEYWKNSRLDLFPSRPGAAIGS